MFYFKRLALILTGKKYFEKRDYYDFNKCSEALVKEMKINRRTNMHPQVSISSNSYAPGKKMVNLFISYHSRDKEYFRRMKDYFENIGFSINDFSGVSSKAGVIANSDFVILLISKEYYNDNECKSEYKYAYERNKTIIPLIMQEGYKPTGW